MAEEAGYAKDDVPFELEDLLKERGAKYSAVAPWQPYSITDERLVTGQNPASAQGVAEKVIAIFESVDVLENTKAWEYDRIPAFVQKMEAG